MAEPVIRLLDPMADAPAVQALCLRAADYITLETGAPPPPDYAQKLLVDAPPTVAAHDVFAFGMEGQGQMHGVATCLRNFYTAGEWYMGLLLLDPAARNAGQGARLAQHVFARARAEQASCIRVAVLDANPRGRRFWMRQGFTPERTVPPDPTGDGHMRHVMKLNWEDGPCG